MKSFRKESIDTQTMNINIITFSAKAVINVVLDR